MSEQYLSKPNIAYFCLTSLSFKTCPNYFWKNIVICSFLFYDLFIYLFQFSIYFAPSGSSPVLYFKRNVISIMVTNLAILLELEYK